MNWNFCVDSPEKIALQLCRGSIDKGSGFSPGGVAGYGYGQGYGYSDGDGGGCSGSYNHGDRLTGHWDDLGYRRNETGGSGVVWS